MDTVPRPDPSPYVSGPPFGSHTAPRARRPIGTLILGVVFLLSGLWLGWQRFSQLMHAFSFDGEVAIHPSFYIGLARDVLSAGTAIGAAIGLLMGRAFGWWLSMVHAYWRLSIQGLLPILGGIVAQLRAGGQPQPNALPEAVMASALFFLIVLYLERTKVRSYFSVTVPHAMVNVIVLLSCLVVAFGLDALWFATVR